MDYEKKYKEALERAKDFMNGKVHYALRRGENIMCWIFPELKESGDERIRKAIVATIHLYYGEPLEDEAKEMIAWLEKQGTSYTKRDVDDAYVEGMAFAKYEFEKQGEQKPTDEEMKELLQTEYEKGRADAIAEMQKPAWSEEDEKCLENAIMYCEWARDKAPDLHCYETSEKSINWLKFLKDRYTWKPSDEQLEELKNATHLKPFENPSDSLLWGLYEQLKKLREE